MTEVVEELINPVCPIIDPPQVIFLHHAKHLVNYIFKLNIVIVYFLGKLKKRNV